jgi:NDP-sugar pyrophosphorylase family protein
MKVVIPMAGKGSRFQAASDQNPEYKHPKPLILVKGKPMVKWAVESLPFVDLPDRPAQTDFIVSPNDLIFIVLQEHEDTHQVTTVLKKIFSPEITVIVIPKVTRGAVETVLTAEKHIELDDDLLITDSDHFYDGTPHYLAIKNKSSDVEGIIPVFQPPDKEPKWSYTLFDKDMTASAVGEKDPELASKGAYANIGAYYFSSGMIFLDEAKKMIEEGDMYGEANKREFYIAPLYQRLIQQGKVIQADIIDKMWGLGTPKDLEYFLTNYKG